MRIIHLTIDHFKNLHNFTIHFKPDFFHTAILGRNGIRKCSYDKCWYCESRVSDVAYGDVDHFRPKNKVEECPEHPDYWWLAFNWKNFR